LVLFLALNLLCGVAADGREFVDVWIDVVFDIDFFVLYLLGFSEILFGILVHAPVWMRFCEFEIDVVTFGLIWVLLVIFELGPGELIIIRIEGRSKLNKRFLFFLFLWLLFLFLWLLFLFLWLLFLLRLSIAWMNLNTVRLFSILGLFSLLHLFFPCVVDYFLSEGVGNVKLFNLRIWPSRLLLLFFILLLLFFLYLLLCLVFFLVNLAVGINNCVIVISTRSFNILPV